MTDEIGHDKGVKEVYIHSTCCNAHWEVVLTNDGKGRIQCEKCGQWVNLDLVHVVHTIEITECSCDVCRGKKEGN